MIPHSIFKHPKLLLYREFVRLDGAAERLPDETTILRFRHLLEKHNLAVDMLRVVNDLLGYKGLMLRSGTAVDATLVAAPSSTKNIEGERDPEMKQSKKGNNYYFGMKAHIGVDMASGLVHTVVTTSGNVSDINMAGALLHGDEEVRASNNRWRISGENFGDFFMAPFSRVGASSKPGLIQDRASRRS